MRTLRAPTAMARSAPRRFGTRAITSTPGGGRQPPEDLVGVRHLRHQPGWTNDPASNERIARRDEPVEQPHLRVGRQRLRMVLQPVAQGHVGDG